MWDCILNISSKVWTFFWKILNIWKLMTFNLHIQNTPSWQFEVQLLKWLHMYLSCWVKFEKAGAKTIKLTLLVTLFTYLYFMLLHYFGEFSTILSKSLVIFSWYKKVLINWILLNSQNSTKSTNWTKLTNLHYLKA